MLRPLYSAGIEINLALDLVYEKTISCNIQLY